MSDPYDLWNGYKPADLRPPPKCECGTSLVYANAEPDNHSDYCPVYTTWKEKQAADAKMQDMYKIRLD